MAPEASDAHQRAKMVEADEIAMRLDRDVVMWNNGDSGLHDCHRDRGPCGWYRTKPTRCFETCYYNRIPKGRFIDGILLNHFWDMYHPATPEKHTHSIHVWLDACLHLP